MPRNSSRHRRTARATGALALFPFLLTPAGKIGAGVLVAALATGGLLTGTPLGGTPSTAHPSSSSSGETSLRPVGHPRAPHANDVVVELDGTPVHLTLSSAADTPARRADDVLSNPGNEAIPTTTRTPDTPRVRQAPQMVPGIHGGPPRIVLQPTVLTGGPNPGQLPPPAPGFASPGASSGPASVGPLSPSTTPPAPPGPQTGSVHPPSGGNPPESSTGTPPAGLSPGEEGNPPTLLAGLPPPGTLPPGGEAFQAGMPERATGQAAPNSIPEPASLALMAAGLAGLLWVRRHARPLLVRPR